MGFRLIAIVALLVLYSFSAPREMLLPVHPFGKDSLAAFQAMEYIDSAEGFPNPGGLHWTEPWLYWEDTCWYIHADEVTTKYNDYLGEPVILNREDPPIEE